MSGREEAYIKAQMVKRKLDDLGLETTRKKARW